MRGVYKFKRGKNAIEFRNDLPMPKIGPDEVLIKTIYGSICSGDAKLIWPGHDDSDDWMTRRIVNPPLIVGAENLGEIVEVGSKVPSLWKVGDRVCAEVLQNNCEQCLWCRADFKPMCPEATLLGRTFDGCFAEYYKSPCKYLHKVPDGCSNEDAALAEMLAAVCTNLTNRTRIKPGDFVVVQGCGTMGQLAAQVAKASGARTVVMTGTNHSKHRLKKALEIGAVDLTINVDEEEPCQKIWELAGGRSGGEAFEEPFRELGGGADVVVDAAGDPRTIDWSLRMVRRRGTIAQIGVHERKPLPATWVYIYMKNLTVNGSDFHDWWCWERALSMLATGKVNGKALLSHTFPFEEWEKGYSLVLNNESTTKVALHP